MRLAESTGVSKAESTGRFLDQKTVSVSEGTMDTSKGEQMVVSTASWTVERMASSMVVSMVMMMGILWGYQLVETMETHLAAMKVLTQVAD